MATDSQDSHRKHRRSPSDDDSPEESKRRRHRHHRRRHHRRHHHRHHKHGNDRKGEIEEEVEEGEIIEEGEVVAVEKNRGDSDVESGEFKVVVDEGQSQFDDSFTRDDAAMASPEDNAQLRADRRKKCNRNSKSTGSDMSDGGKKHGSHHHHDESSISEGIVNGDFGNRSSRRDSRSHARSKSPVKESSKRKVHRESESKQESPDLMEVDEDEYGGRRNSSSHKVRSRSPSHGRHHLDNSDRSRTTSPHQKRERDRSQSILNERFKMSLRPEKYEGLYDNGKTSYEFDDVKDSRRSTYYRLDRRDVARDKRRERSSSSHSMSERKDEDGDSWDREREKKMQKDKKKVKEHEISREREERDHVRNRDLEKERDRNLGDREWGKESDRDRGKARETKNDMEWDTDRDRERNRDQDRGRSRDRELDRERRRDDSIASYRDRDTRREWDSKLRDRDRRVEIDRGRDRNSARDRYRDKPKDVEYDRSRRYHKYDNRDDGYGNRDRRHGYEDAEYRRDRDRKNALEKDWRSKDDVVKENADGINRDDDDQKDYQERVDLELAEQEDDDTERIKEESRRLREAILEKYKAQQSQNQAMPQSAKASNEERADQPSQNLVVANAAEKDVHVETNSQDSYAVKASFDLKKFPSYNGTADVEKNTAAGGLGEGTPKSERSNDMFGDDIFGDSPAGVRKKGRGDGLPVVRSGLHDNWDDPEGYYSFRLGEILDSRYEITAAHGKGVFSTVVRAKDLKAGSGDPEEVAIKIIRNNETMLKAGTEELVILKKLVGADPEDRRHCVRYLSNFKYRNHLCIVFESLHMNLREVLKKFGRNIGLKLTAVRAYAKQLFIALKHLRNCGVLHCDIKPDNMLVNDAKNVLKLCDFGNAMFAGKNEITPYLVSRFYRAPEIILGLPYDHPMDIWSIGCCLYELYTGKVLFPGSTNNDMLRLHMELKGLFPKKMLRKGAFVEQHFAEDLTFLAEEEDPVTKKIIRRPMPNIKPKDIGTIIKGFAGEDPKLLANFKDLLDKIFILDPDKRLTVSQALSHPFITGK